MKSNQDKRLILYEPPEGIQQVILSDELQFNEMEYTLLKALAEQHKRIGQLDIPYHLRTRTAINYAIHIQSFFNFMRWKRYRLPTANHIEEWRDGMDTGIVPRRYKYDENGNLINPDFRRYSRSGINVRLTAVRRLLRNTAREISDPTLKLNLRDWAEVAQLKAMVKQDTVEEDYGIRLSLAELTAYFNGIPNTDLITLRDRALVALMAGAGLRVREATHVTMKDVFCYTTEENVPAIHVRNGKGNKSRLVALSDDSWVLKTVREYTDARGLDEYKQPNTYVLSGYQGQTLSEGQTRDDLKAFDTPLSNVAAWEIVGRYPAIHKGRPVRLKNHDLRRTYAKLCIEAGMDWDALRANLGHTDIKTTQTYVGRATSLTKRVPDWSI